MLARTLELLGLRSAAVWAYQRTLRHRANDADLHLRLGETLAGLERWDAAAHALRHAARLRPRCCETHGNLALALHRAGRDQAALEALSALCALHPRRAELHVLLGAWLRRRHRPAEALRAFRDALSAEPAPPTTRFFLGEAMLGVEEWQALLRELEHARRTSHAATTAVSPRARPRARGGDPTPPARGRERLRATGRALVARWARDAGRLADAFQQLACQPRRLALLLAGRWHARRGRAAHAIRCFREAQALRAPGVNRGPEVVRQAPARPARHGTARGIPWLARRGAALP